MKQTLESSELWGWISWTPHQGSELVGLIRELETSMPGPTWVEGYGELRDPIVLTQSEAGGRFERRLSGTWDMLVLRGSPKGDLYALLARDSVLGPQHIGGLLSRGTVVTASLRVGAAVGPARGAGTSPTSSPSPAGLGSEPTSRPAETRPHASPSSPGSSSPMGSSTMPKRPQARDTSVEQYPEEGDVVTHFAFGRCSVLFSDGERLRLQQERDGRVREVALSMLKMEDPTMLDTGRRHWDLSRKN